MKKYLLSKKTIGGILILIAIILFAVVDSENSTATSNQSSTAAPVAVEVTPVAVSALSENVTAVGNISAMTDAVVSSETAGRVTRVAVKVGDYVKTGQILFQIDDELRAIAVEQAKAQLLAAETNFSKSQKDYSRAQKLYESKDISDAELEGNKLGMQAAEAQYKSALVGTKLAQRQYDDTKIKSPINGIVASRRVDLGETVSPGREVANIVDISKVKVKISIPEEQIGLIRLKQPAVLRIDSDPSTEFKGMVYTAGSKTESPNGHSYPVEVIVENKNVSVLKVGMFARVSIQIRTAPNALVISKESLVNEDSGPQVYVVENHIAKLRSVKLGIRSGDKVQVTGGLKQGELVISFGQKKLKDGSPVQYK
jgi:membrane fusion protein (multidrug efflux system)